MAAFAVAKAENCAMTENLLSRVVNGRLRAYGEEWLREYRVADLCSKFEQRLAGFLEVFNLIVSTNREWREQVFRGERVYKPEDDEEIKEFFQSWIGCDDHIQQELASYESQGYEGGVAGSKEYRECLAEAQRILSEWKAPELTAAIGLRHIKWDQKQSEQLRKVL